MAKANNRKIRVLAVEDDQQMRTVLEMTYSNTYRYDDAETLAEAREKLLRKAYDVVVLDIELPDGKGTDLLRELRSDPRFSACRNLPVVMLTACEDEGLWEATWELGSVAYVRKPFEIPDLSEAIRRAVVNPVDADALAPLAE